MEVIHADLLVSAAKQQRKADGGGADAPKKPTSPATKKLFLQALAVYGRGISRLEVSAGKNHELVEELRAKATAINQYLHQTRGE